MRHRPAILCLLFSLLMADAAWSQIQFQDRSSWLRDSSVRSGVAMAVVDMNGDLKDDIVRLHLARNLSIEYQQAPGAEFEAYVYGSVSSRNQWSLCVADADGNGFNDILCGGAYDGIKLLLSSRTGATYTSSLLPGPSMFLQGSNFADIDGDGLIDIFACHDDAESHKHRNLGYGVFDYDPSLIDTRTSPPSDNSGNYGSVWTDFNNDGRLDLYIAKCRQGVNSDTDPRRINQLFRNDGNTFTEMADDAGLAIGAQSWTADFGDIDNDGDLDAFVVNHYDPSSLYRNNGDGTFTDITSSAFLSGDIDLFGIQTLFRDLDNDGYIDILITGSEHRVFHNNGNGSFSVVSNPSLGSSWIESMAVGDLNDDGFLDVYAGYANLFNSPSSRVDRLFINQANSANNYLKVHLQGKQSGHNGIGARLELEGPWGTQVREVRAGESYGICNSFTQHFGMANLPVANRLVVRWPSGIVDELHDVSANQTLVLIEGSTLGYQTAYDLVVDRSDDAEEASNGTVFRSGNDLELVENNGDLQTVGLRFQLDVPNGATITEAHIQFTADEIQSAPAALSIRGERSDDSPPIEGSDFALTSRIPTSAIVAWSPPPWQRIGEDGPRQRTPNLREIVQEIVDRPGWNPGQSLLFLIQGSGHRTAESYNGSRGQAPQLRVKYTERVENHPPEVDAGKDLFGRRDQGIFVHATVADEAAPSLQWTQLSGPGTVVFSSPQAALTRVDFTAPGSYRLRLTATDQDHSVSDDVVLQALESSPVESLLFLGGGFEDAEERQVGSLSRGSADLELVNDGLRGDQIVGLRYAIPLTQQSRLLEARIQFNVDEPSFGESSLKIQLEDSQDADPIQRFRYDLSRRLHGGAFVPWSPVEWPFLDAANEDQRTPCLRPLIQPIIDRSGWASQNAILFLIQGQGVRTADAFDGSMSKAPRLRLFHTQDSLNSLPHIDAGEDQAVGIDSLVRLEGRVYDREGVSHTWSQVSGPSLATIVNPSALDSELVLSQSGPYVFRLEVQDSSDIQEDWVCIDVVPGETTCVSSVIESGTDDAEESIDGTMYRRGTDLELVEDGSRGAQTVGLRFVDLAIPEGAEIVSAYVQFTTDEADSQPCALTIRAEDANDASTIEGSPFNLSTRNTTTQSAFWAPSAWGPTGESGPNQRTSDLSSVIEEVVNRPGWQPGNALLILLTGSGTRTAESVEGAPSAAARLHVEYR